MRRAVSLLGLMVFIAGCGAVDEPPIVSDSPPSVESDLCRGGSASPVPIADVVAALETRGFDMVLEERDPSCEIGSVVAHMSNSTGTGGLSENADRMGHVICTVHERPTSVRLGFRERPGDDKIIFYAVNVRCTVYTRSEDGGRGVPQLRDAMREFSTRS